jgi:hypothetical protein
MSNHISKKSIIDEQWHGPKNSSLQNRSDIRQRGGIFPEQQTFLGATIKSFNISAGTGSTPTTLNVELISDPNGTNPTIDDPQKSRGVYDPYHHNQIGDSFSPPAVGMPVFFVYSNPRITIKQAYDPNVQVSQRDSVLKFGGLLQSFNSTSSVGGHTYSVTVVDPREILGSIYLILNHSDDKVGNNENNVFNVFGFLEYNPSKSLRTRLNGKKANILTRSGAGFTGDDMYYDGAIPTTDFNYTGYFDSSGWPDRFPITGSGMSRRSSYGMPYYRIMQALAGMSGALPSSEYDGFAGSIRFRGLKYNVTFLNLPPLNPMYFFDGDNMDLLSFISELAEASGHEMVITLVPDFSNSSTVLVGGTINIDFIDRTGESAVGQIRNFMKAEFPQSDDGEGNQFSIVEKEDLGYEMTNPTTSRILFGSNRVDLYAFTSNHDDGRWNKLVGGQGGGGSLYSDQIVPFYGLLKDNVIVPTAGYGPWRQILLDSSGVGAYGVGNYYVATETELRYALAGFNKWKNFLEYYNGKFLDILTLDRKAKYEDVLIADGGKLDFTDDVNEQHTRGLKAPRCLFTNDVGTYQNGTLRNPCCPPHGYPLYYNRANAIGLSLTKVINDSSSTTADLNILRANGEDAVSFHKIRNALLEKYEALGFARPLTQQELDTVKLLRQQAGGYDKDYVDSILKSMQGQIVNPKKSSTARKENCLKVFNFVKSIAEECYGKKWLVRIPPKPNYKFDSDGVNGVSLTANNRIYNDGFFGISPVALASGASLTGACPAGESFVTTANDPRFNEAQSKFKSGLITNYNPISDSLVYNYVPSTEGGFVTYGLYQKGVASCLIPRDLHGFGSDHRIKAYVRYDHAEYLNLSNSSSNVYTEYVGERTDVIPGKSATVDYIDAAVSGQTMVAYIPVQLDAKLYYPPKTYARSVSRYGNWKVKNYYIPYPVGLDASGNVLQNAGNVKRSIDIEPTLTPNGNVTITDYPRDADGKIIPYPNLDYAFALITIHSLVSTKREGIDTNIKKQKYNVATYPGYFSDEQDLNTVSHIKINRRLDFQNYGSSITFYHPDRLFSVPMAIKPDVAVIPLEDQQTCYGPWYSGPVRFKDANGNYQYRLLKDLGGKVDISHNGSLAPWNFGSYDLMDVAGNSQVQIANTLYLASEKGSVSYPGLPAGKQEVGYLAAAGGPILDSISLDVGIDGVRSTYRFQTYSRSFALLQKQQQKQIDRLQAESKKASSIQFDLLHKGLIKNKFSGQVPQPTYKPYVSAINDYYAGRPLDLIMASVVEQHNGGKPWEAGNDGVGVVNEQGAAGSSEGLQESLAQDSDVNEEEDYNGAIQSVSEKNIAVAQQYHHMLPHVRQAELEQMESLYTNATDPYSLRRNIVTYWS